MKTKKTAGEDYVHPVHGNIMPDFLGISKREYFAINSSIPWEAAAKNLDGNFPERKGTFTISDVAEYRARMMVAQADALIVELNREQ